MRLPRDLLDEIDLELRAEYTRRRSQGERLLMLEELRAITVAAAGQLGRPVSAADLVTGASDAVERDRRRTLVQALRAGGHENVGPDN